MSSCFRNALTEVPTVESVKRQLDFDERSSLEMESEFLRAPTRGTKRSRRLDFGKTDPSVQLRFPDFEDQIAFHSEALRWNSCRSIFSAMQKDKLEAMFLKNKYPTRAEKATLAATLDITINKVQTWFSNRRQKWRRQQKKKIAGPFGQPSVLPRLSLIKRTSQSTASLQCYSQCPIQQPEQSQPPSSALHQATVPFAPSLQTAQSFFACNQTYPQEYQPQPKYLQRPFSPQYYAVPNLPAIAETISSPYLPFSHLMQRIPQRYPNAYLPPSHSKDSEPSQTTCQPMDAFHASKAESTRLADEFPFSYSIAKEMPHIFGNMEDDEVLDHPLTPSFECSSDLAPSREIVTHESCQFGFTTTDFSDCVLPEQSEISRNRPHSCCFGGNSVQSHPLIKEPSYGLMSEGRSLRFYRHD